MTLTEFEALLKIDKNDLDTALVEQPDIFYRVSEQAALVESERDYQKMELDRVKASVELSIRAKVAESGAKSTESQISAAVTTHDDVVSANTQYLKCKETTAFWKALQEAFIQRQYVISKLCDLYQSGYYGALTAAVGSEAKGRRAQEGRKGMHELRIKEG